MVGKVDRLALYLPSLRGGGAERVMVTLANEFASRGYQVDLVVAHADGPFRSEVADGVNVVNLRARRVLASIPGLIRYLRNNRPDALLSAMGHTNIAALLAKELSGVGCRLVVSEHTHLSNANGGGPSRKGFLVRRLRRALYPRADSVVAVSSGVADDLAQISNLDRAALSVIHNPVTRPEMVELRREPVEHPWLNDRAVPVVMGMGRLTPAKDFLSLIRAFARLRETMEARLLILGEGELRPVLEAEVERFTLSEYVSMPGFVSNPYAHVARADVFALSSRWEGFGNVLVEAMACGTPVVSTDCDSGPAEILEDGAWGRLVPVGDAEALANALQETLEETDRPDVEQRAQAFTVDAAVDAYLRLLVPEGSATNANNAQGAE